jgi:hypothetical protein
MLAREMLPLTNMRGFLLVVAAVGMSGVFYWQKNHAASAAPAKPDVVQTAPPLPPGSQHETITQSRPVSEHNWMKRSLDRATDVRNTARAQTQQSQDP